MVVVWVLLAVAAFVVVKVAHAQFFPWKDCGLCGGSKRIYSMGAHRDCPRCGAEGRVRRWGAPREER